MRFLLAPAMAVCVLAIATDARGAISGYPRHEVWVGSGVGTMFEKSLFNLPNDLEARPDAAVSLGYVHNFDARRAVCYHLYGAVESQTRITLPGGQTAEFELVSFNLGVRYRHTFMRGEFNPYVFVGGSWAGGDIERKGVPDLSYNGISACMGLGGAVPLGRHVMLSAEGLASPGVAVWEHAPFAGASGKKFNPSLTSATIHLSFVWGSPAGQPRNAGTETVEGAPAEKRRAPGFAAKALLAEGLIALNAAMASGSPGGYGVIFILLSPLAAADVHTDGKAERIFTLATFESIGVYNLIMAAGDHSEEVVFNGNMIAWNAAIAVTWAAQQTVFKNKAPGGGGTGTKGTWSAAPGVVGGGPGLRVAYRF